MVTFAARAVSPQGQDEERCGYRESATVSRHVDVTPSALRRHVCVEISSPIYQKPVWPTYNNLYDRPSLCR